jgi:DNA (cytosine-5)-methyltransferase 1
VFLRRSIENYTVKNTLLASRPIAVDLFAGAGGLSLGFEQAGFDIAAAVEIDPIHSAIHHFNFPNTITICASVTDLTGNDIRQRANLNSRDIDVVCGGAPCQGFSLIGQRAMDDPRNQLVFHFVRLVKELGPKYFVFENVKGLTVGTHKKFLHEVVEAFQALDYEILLPWQVLNAADFGVPQDRKRLFLIGARRGCRLPEYPKHTNSVTVADAIMDLPNVDDFDELLNTDKVRAKFKSLSRYAKILRGKLLDAENFGYLREFDSNSLTDSARTVHTARSIQRFMDTPQGEVEKISRFLKLSPNGVCNTLRAGTDSARGAFTSPRPIHPLFPRVITVREAARLHSYPDWFRFHSTKWHGFREIGNSVPPFLARAVAAQIMIAMRIVPLKPTLALKQSDEFLLNLNMSAAAKFFSVSSRVIGQRTRQHESSLPSSTQLRLIAEQKRKRYAVEIKD